MSDALRKTTRSSRTRSSSPTAAAGLPAPRKRAPAIVIAGCGVAVALILVLVAVLRPKEGASPPGLDGDAESVARIEPPASDLVAVTGPASRPAAGAALAGLQAADAAFDAGDFSRARDLYVDLLLEGGDFEDAGAEVLGWAHGRLALALARIAHGPAPALLDEPPLTFRRDR